MNVKMAFASRLKELREGKNLSQSKLAEEINLSRGSISFYESGSRTPDIETLDEIAEYFGVSYDYLLGKSGITNRDEEKEAEKNASQLFEVLKLLQKSTREKIINAITELVNHSNFPKGELLVPAATNILEQINAIGQRYISDVIIAACVDKVDEIEDVDNKISDFIDSQENWPSCVSDEDKDTLIMFRPGKLKEGMILYVKGFKNRALSRKDKIQEISGELIEALERHINIVLERGPKNADDPEAR